MLLGGFPTGFNKIYPNGVYFYSILAGLNKKFSKFDRATRKINGI